MTHAILSQILQKPYAAAIKSRDNFNHTMKLKFEITEKALEIK